MNDYMRALHQLFFREPDVSELEEDIENTRQEVRDCLDKMQRRRLMHLVDTQNLLREEISLSKRMNQSNPAPCSGGSRSFWNGPGVRKSDFTICATRMSSTRQKNIILKSRKPKLPRLRI